MSAIVGIFSQHRDAQRELDARRSLAHMRARGEEVAVAVAPFASMGSSGLDWEAAWTGGPRVARLGAVTVVADATLYYRDDLRRRLLAAGVVPEGDAAADLIAAAYVAWGERWADRLEGDIACILFDAQRRTVHAISDYQGFRPLHYALLGDTLVVASTIGGVRAHPMCSDALNVVSMAETLSGLYAASHETCFRDVMRLKAGDRLRFAIDSRTLVVTPWAAPEFVGDMKPAVPFDRAAEELRALLRDAVAERFGPGERAAVTLSGGWDSTSVFAAGQAVLRDRGLSADHLPPVSVSYPVGDDGREDEWIEATAAFWGTTPSWIDIRDVPFFDRPAARAATRDEPMAHPFEMWNRAIARAARDTGCAVALNGVGGDALFHTQPAYLADAVRRGRLLYALAEWRRTGAGDGDWREFVRYALLPLIPAGARRALGALRGGAPRGYLERALPDFIQPAFAAEHRLLEREAELTPRASSGGHAEAYNSWVLRYPYIPRVHAMYFQVALEEGVEQRAPLMDQRVMEFAASRPRTERREGRETKRLLRAAVQGLAPEHVLAPRARRTGTTGHYYARAMQHEFPRLAEPLFRAPRLAELGVVDQGKLYAEGRALEQTARESVPTSLYFTYQTELWLRAQSGAAVEESPVAPAVERNDLMAVNT